MSEPLIDSFGRKHTYLRISVTDRCNLRCTYCMPAEGIDWQARANILRFEEIVRLVKLFARMGINKVRFTGGEPLLRRGIARLVADVAAIEGISTVAMTTNGVLLKDKILDLKTAGLSKLNISLDTLRPDRFKRITLGDHYGDVLDAIQAAIDAGLSPLKLNMVVMGGVNDDELPDFLAFVKDKPIHLRFIEFMPFKDNQWSSGSCVSYAKMKARLEKDYELKPVPNDEDPSNVAREFQIAGFSGTVGFITSMSEDFCDTCSRVRITADGAFKSCLHHPAEISLRDAMRSGQSDASLESMIRESMQHKPERHAPSDELVQIENRTMIQIGG